jgi:hypothetical protein
MLPEDPMHARWYGNRRLRACLQHVAKVMPNVKSFSCCSAWEGNDVDCTAETVCIVAYLYDLCGRTVAAPLLCCFEAYCLTQILLTRCKRVCL